MLKVNQELKAKNSTDIIRVEAVNDNTITYKCYGYANKHLGSDDNYDDGLFRDTEAVLLEHYTCVTPNQ